MRLLEFQAKRLFQEAGLSVPAGRLLRSPLAARELSFPVVLKAQVPVGGRGKAGAVKILQTPPAALAFAERLWDADIKGYCVKSLYAEQPIAADAEYYLSLYVDSRCNQPVFMTTAAGGVDVEAAAAGGGNAVQFTPVDTALGLRDFTIRALARSLNVSATAGFSAFVKALYRLFFETEATLIEINPLVFSENSWMCLDAKMMLDEKSAWRHPALYRRLKSEQETLVARKRTPAEERALSEGLNYVHLDGAIGLIADGAGTGMLTMDMVADAGARAANFCEMGGLSDAQTMSRAMAVVLSDARVKVLLISLIGGMTRMDQMADGIVQYLNRYESLPPVVVRMCGTMAEKGCRTLRRARVAVFEDLETAVCTAVDRWNGE